jgi:hypothetical protein
MSESIPAFKGTPIFLNGKEYILPSVSLLQLQQNFDLLTSPGTGSIVDLGNRFIPLIGSALRRNYPDVTDEQLWEWLDLNTFPEAIKALQASSGLKAVAPGE